MTIAGLLAAGFVGCGKSSSEHESSAGRAADRGGTGSSDAGEGGTGETSGAGRGGGAPAAGNAGSSGGAARGGAAGVGGAVITSGTGGTSGSIGAAGSPTALPAGWRCEAAYYDDGECDCGCGAEDEDCDDSDDIDECERCKCPGGCPGRVDPDDTRRCLPAAEGWTCGDSSYGDGENCDCGCGAVDLDCDDANVESCEVCDHFGSCANGDCPSNLVADDNTRCVLPANWLCEPEYYGDGICNCGCGLIDIDCDGPSVGECVFCPVQGCAYYGCPQLLMPDDNSLCAEAPFQWLCSARLYNDGSQCDCGCGFRDPDCSENSIDACDKCNDAGSCSGQACPGIINPDSTERCIQPPPPPEWTCPSYYYADAFDCHCGCGALDPDCRINTLEGCEQCTCGSGNCEATVDPNDPTQCLPPPDGWLCPPEAWNNFDCDCGCGVLDPSCGDPSSNYCFRCIGCAEGDCTLIDPVNNTQCLDVPETWTCTNSDYRDSVCDCGCGAFDAACASADASACEFCNAEGSCSDVTCADPNSPINATNNAVCD